MSHLHIERRSKRVIFGAVFFPRVYFERCALGFVVKKVCFYGLFIITIMYSIFDVIHMAGLSTNHSGWEVGSLDKLQWRGCRVSRQTAVFGGGR